MARFRRYGRRRYYRRSRFGGRRFGRRFGRRRYGRRRSRSTRSAPVKLTLEANFATSNSSGIAQAFTFNPSIFPGFSQYSPVYSEFRILQAKIYIHRSASTNAVPPSYLVVPSGPFADVQPPLATSGESIQSTVLPAPKTEAELRQARWQRLIYPSTTKTVTRVRFRPYTFLLSGGPVNVSPSGTALDPAVTWMRRQDARRWMPLQWTLGDTAHGTSLTFYGPYIWLNQPNGGTPSDGSTTISVTLECFFQFRGQV